MTTAAPSLLIRRLSRGQLLAFDRALAVVTALFGWFAAVESPMPSQPGWREPGWVSIVAAVLLAAPVAVRRVWPVAAVWSVLAVAAACTVSGVIPEYAGLAPTIVLCLVLYTVGVEVPGSRSVRIVIVAVVVSLPVFLLAGGQPFVVALVAWVIGACWTIGRTLRERRAYAARATEQATELAVGAERLRIARELHDIVAHSMSVIAVQATIAEHLADARPQAMREALRVISGTSRDALGELRRALGALRTEGTFVPTPGLADLGELAAAARSTGLAVDLEVHGADELPDGVGLAVFRLVQEALTNVVKHARASRCRVGLDIGPDSVQIEVADDGPAALRGPEPSAAGGQGLIGMRERAALFGGELTAGPRADGGWLVATTLRWA